jgi:O-antigen ligase
VAGPTTNFSRSRDVIGGTSLWATVGLAVSAGVLAAAVSIAGGAINPLLPIAVAVLLGLSVLAIVRPFATFYLGLGATPLEAASLDVGALGLTPAEGLLVLTAMGWLLKRSVAGQAVIVRSPITAPFAFGLAIMALGLLVSETPLNVAKVLGLWTVFFVLVQMVLAEGDPRVVRRVILAVALAGAAFGAVAIATNGGQEVSEFGRTASGRARAGFGSPNRLGEYLAMALPCQVALLLMGPRYLRLPMIACIGLSSVGLALTLSRGAIAGIAGAFLLLLLWRPFRRAFVVTAAVLLAVSVVGLNPFGRAIKLDVLAERVTSIRYEAGLNPRRVALQNSPAVMVDHPLVGVGAGSLESVAPEYGLVLEGAPMQNAHNMFLHVGAERGLLGLAAFIWLLAAFGRSLLHACRRSSGENLAYAFAIAAVWLSLLIEGAADSVLQQNAIAVAAFLFMACAVVLERAADQVSLEKEADPHRERIPGRVGRPLEAAGG